MAEHTLTISNDDKKTVGAFLQHKMNDQGYTQASLSKISLPHNEKLPTHSVIGNVMRGDPKRTPSYFKFLEQIVRALQFQHEAKTQEGLDALIVEAKKWKETQQPEKLTISAEDKKTVGAFLRREMEAQSQTYLSLSRIELPNNEKMPSHASIRQVMIGDPNRSPSYSEFLGKIIGALKVQHTVDTQEGLEALVAAAKNWKEIPQPEKPAISVEDKITVGEFLRNVMERQKRSIDGLSAGEGMPSQDIIRRLLGGTYSSSTYVQHLGAIVQALKLYPKFDARQNLDELITEAKEWKAKQVPTALDVPAQDKNNIGAFFAHHIKETQELNDADALKELNNVLAGIESPVLAAVLRGKWKDTAPYQEAVKALAEWCGYHIESQQEKEALFGCAAEAAKPAAVVEPVAYDSPYAAQWEALRDATTPTAEETARVWAAERAAAEFRARAQLRAQQWKEWGSPD